MKTLKRSIAILSLCVFVFAMTSCKKDWTCVCTDNNGVEIASVEITDASKSDAEDACNGSVTVGGTVGGSCDLSEK